MVVQLQIDQIRSLLLGVLAFHFARAAQDLA
jgi:hypothetical protein